MKKISVENEEEQNVKNKANDKTVTVWESLVGKISIYMFTA